MISSITRRVVRHRVALPKDRGSLCVSSTARPAAAATVHWRCLSSDSSSAATSTEYDHLLVEQRGRAGLITFNRPRALNALSTPLIREICSAAEAFDSDPSVGAVVLTGSTKAFAAGADITEMSDLSFAEAYGQDKFSEWSRLAAIRKPMIAAVNGYAFGGGCELAMMCDIIYAGDKAVFGQPEINLGVIPGWGGTQRLIRAVGKSKAMEMILTGRRMKADEAERSGLVAAVHPSEELVERAIEVANTIGGKSHLSVLMCKEAVNAAENLGVRDGLALERRLFHSLFATEDQKEGMAAFQEKREPNFKHK